MEKKRRLFFFSLLGLALVGLGLLLGTLWKSPERETLQPLRQSATQLKFVEPLLAVGNFELLRDFGSLQYRIERMVTQFKAEKSAKRVSVYFRDLASGRWMGTGENEKYAPASMYKVALLLTILKAAESDPSLLFHLLTFQNGMTPPSEREPAPRLIVGQSYSITKLLQYLIVNSDNDAKNLLQSFISPESRREVFTDLGLTPPDLNDTGDSLSAKDYSIFFRVLFNGTYLSPASSESALELLSRPEFTEGLVAGIPKETSVAHKFGRRIFNEVNAPAREELHDCGNVYLANHPYFLCVMTEGWSDETLSGIISQISQTVYNYTLKEYQ